MIAAPSPTGSLALREEIRQAVLYERAAWAFFGLSLLGIPLMWNSLGSEAAWVRYMLICTPIGIFLAAMSNRRDRRRAEVKLLQWQTAFANAAESLESGGE